MSNDVKLALLIGLGLRTWKKLHLARGLKRLGEDEAEASAPKKKNRRRTKRRILSAIKLSIEDQADANTEQAKDIAIRAATEASLKEAVEREAVE
ncbi:hypothetical protein LWI28_009049 [Acer negundo]|uniref:Uncharacterized protein n=1 Tax=Acer negundo TaxID=4023 RepID=A0AAD5IDX7_ACENE|nr:hypothetical protein LWI28_009049 [Acer negundo]KAK4836963.1 hypothetical protein QYF36_001675 [Acer negundo]